MTTGAFIVPDGITPIEGLRIWTYTFDGARGRLDPVGVGDVGPSPWDGAGSTWVRAVCLRDDVFGPADHEVPSESCTCGFYAVKELAHLMPLFAIGATVVGRVELAGTVIEHEIGYRAARARILELFPWLGREAEVRRLALSLGVGVGQPIALPSPGPGPSAPRRPLASWTLAKVREHRARRASRNAA
jgi:hypothetical protein